MLYQLSPYDFNSNPTGIDFMKFEITLQAPLKMRKKRIFKMQHF